MKIPGSIPVSFVKRMRGSVSAYELRPGVMAVRAWPRKRGKARTAAQKNAQDTFAAVQYMTKYMDAPDQIAAQELSAGTAYLPRDIMTACCYGKFITAYLADGRVLYGRRSIAVDIQPVLDSITDAIGSMLVRTSTGWAALVPGEAGTVLQSNGATAVPSFKPGGSGSGGGLALASRVYLNTNFSESATNWYKVPYDTIDHDTAGAWDATNQRWCPQTAGYYLLGGRVRSANKTTYLVGIRKNGAWLSSISPDSGAVGYASAGWDVVEFNGSTDYAEIWVYNLAESNWSLGPGDSYSNLLGPVATV